MKLRNIDRELLIRKFALWRSKGSNLSSKLTKDNYMRLKQSSIYQSGPALATILVHVTASKAIRT